MKRPLLLLSFALISSIVLAQTPDAFKYQAVVRDNSGNLITEQVVGIQIDILKGATDGTSVYTETHSETTNAYGLVNLEIGYGTSTDDFSAINWGDDDYFIQVSLDATGGTSYELMGTSQLLSVPYALHSTVADSVVKESQTLAIDGNTLSISDGNSVDLPTGGAGDGNYTIHISGDISDSEAAQKLADELGPNTRNILVYQTTNLTSLDLSAVTVLDELHINNNPSLSVLNLDNFESCNSLSILQCNSITSLDFSMLSQCWSYNISDCESLSIISCPKLISTFKLWIFRCNNIVNLSFPELKSANAIEIVNTGISDINLPNLISVYLLNSLSNKLTSESVNSILAILVNLTYTPVEVWLSNNNPPAPPTGQGLIDKSTLQSNGAQVYTD